MAGWGAVLAILTGWALKGGVFPGPWLDRVSYDLPFVFWKNTPVEEAVVVLMDEEAYGKLKPELVGERWDRKLHIQLLDRLRASGAKGVVFDLLFDSPWPDPNVDAELVAAMRRQGHVVVAQTVSKAAYFPKTGAGISVHSAHPPIDLFATNVSCGLVELPQDSDLVLRRHPAMSGNGSMGWLATAIAGATVDGSRETERWINYYGADSVLTRSYYQVISNLLAPDFFRNKVVFVGKGLLISSKDDRFNTPYTPLKVQQATGVEIQARVFLNLLRGDWLRRQPWMSELGILLLSGLLAGAGLSLVRPGRAALLAVVAMFGVTFVALAILVQSGKYWFPWMTIVGAQIPVALVWSVLAHSAQLRREKERLETRLSAVERATALTGAPEGTRPVIDPPSIPDHVLVRRVGQGAYGEVWLARNVIATYHAVKVVYRAGFDKAEPFEREFRGVQRVMPFSREHPGWVPILHVGRSPKDDFFYYIMEIADDCERGRQIDPDQYRPHSLAEEIHRAGRLPLRRCVQLGLDLARALDFLHGHQLVHRDIKPANVVFVAGKPRFADIGLVTRMSQSGEPASLLGTRGFMAPEGPGAAAADIYSLGKLLYQAATGLEVALYPELPTALVGEDSGAAFWELYEIIGKACAPDPAARYATAEAMRQAFAKLAERSGV